MAPALAVICGIAACASRLPHPSYVAQGTQSLEAVSFPPPPARVEIVPKRPDAKGAVWIDGEWVWQGLRWGWKPGRWVVPPPGVRFAPWTEVRGADGTVYYAHGAWLDARNGPAAEPDAIAMATTNLSDVVDPEGNLETTGPSIRRPNEPEPDAGLITSDGGPAKEIDAGAEDAP